MKQAPVPGNPYLEQVQNNWIEIKPRLREGEVVHREFEEKLKDRFFKKIPVSLESKGEVKLEWVVKQLTEDILELPKE